MTASQTHRIPIIKLYDSLIVSIQLSLSDKLINQLKDDVTDRIVKTSVTGLVVDVSGIDLMDSYISRALRDLSLIASLMGVRTVICGMHPVIAMTLIEMGLEMKGMKTALNLEAALELLAKERRTEAEGDAGGGDGATR
jgi:rsbT antagonist protein RsbS